MARKRSWLIGLLIAMAGAAISYVTGIPNISLP